MNRTNVSGSLDAYLQYIGKQPMLTLDQESELAARIQTGDKAALYQLMKGNLRFVVSVLLPYQRKGKSLLELIRAGNKGLKRAAERFVPSEDCKFIAYAVWYIRQSIEDSLDVEE